MNDCLLSTGVITDRYPISVLAEELKSGAPPLLSIVFSFDGVERIKLKTQLCFDL